MQKNNFNTIIIVTSDFHSLRSMVIANEWFGQFTNAPAATPLNGKKIVAYVKETLAIIKYLALKQ